MKNKIKIICLTPIKNESWLLDNFLRAASVWADYIIIADQMSSDGSREIAKKYKKVILIDNNSIDYSEIDRQNILINEARKIDGPKLLITLDADEFFTPNCQKSFEWKKMLSAPEGTVFQFFWANLCPDMKNMWSVGPFSWALVDDGKTQHKGSKIHNARIPLPENGNPVLINDIKVMHFQYTSWHRMESKHRWYQCYERINFPQKNPIDIFRTYHHMYAIPKNNIKSIPQIWFDDYKKMGIDINLIIKEKKFYWDEKVLNYFDEFGFNFFRKEFIWNIDWNEVAKTWGLKNNGIKDPRNLFDKFVHFYLFKTQKYSKSIFIKLIDKILKNIW